MDNKAQILACGILTIGIILIIILIPLSISTVKPDEYGVVYDRLWRTFDKKILTQGRHVLKPTSRVITFPNTYETIDFTTDATDINCISKDGLVVTIDAVSNYKYIQDQLIQTLYTYDKSMGQFMTDLARSTFNDVCTLYEVESGFIDARQNISNSMLSLFQDGIVESSVPSKTIFAELRGYQYSNEYKNAITRKQNAQQEIDLLLSQRNVLTTNAQTNLNNANQQAQIGLQQASTQVQTILTMAESEAQAIENRWIQYANGFSQTMIKLQIDPDTFVETYLSLAHIDDQDNPNLIYVNF